MFAPFGQSGNRIGSMMNQDAAESSATKSMERRHIVDYLPGWMTPNHLTFMRFGLAGFMIVLDYQGFGLGWVIILGLIAGATDLADGALARRRNLVTSLGAFLDPLGDKLFAVVLLLMVWRRGFIEPWVILLILVCELHAVVLPFVSIIRRKLKGQKLWPPPKVRANRFGKYKTAWLASAMGLMIIGSWLEAQWMAAFGYYNVFCGHSLGPGGGIPVYKSILPGRARLIVLQAKVFEP